MASVRPCVGRTEPVDSGIQSIWFLNTAVCGGGSVFCVVFAGGVLQRNGRAYKITMLLGRHPKMPVTPDAQVAQLLHFRVVLFRVVFDGQVGGVEDAHVAA